MREPARGTITFLFTDIEGSTQLWEQCPDAMRHALARHDALLRGAIESHGGQVFKTGGDAFCAAFSSAPAALAAAHAAQRALLDCGLGIADCGIGDDEPPMPADAPSPLPVSPHSSDSPQSAIPNPQLKVRMALHSGEAEERDRDYFGPPLNRVARLLSAAHGGQTLLSQATADLARDFLPEGASLRDLGMHRLKDLQQPERIFQLAHPELPGDFPPPRSLEAFAHNLPRQASGFVGREREMEEIRRLLASTCLLTLTGAGGCGKTRLALQVAADLVDEFPDGVWLVELAALAEDSRLPQAVASALGVREEPGRALDETLAAYLRTRELLLVLDNCEHQVLACARLAEGLLRACPSLHVLATSREGLGIPGELAYRVPSLAQEQAVRLFAQRAGFVQPQFRVTERNAAGVAQICRRLDGIPLAIELAAARTSVLSVEQILSRLDDRFRLLTGGSRTALPRQQTLRAAIDWSYDLLSGPERKLFHRLSVFADGWSLEAAEAVCCDAGGREQAVVGRRQSAVREGGLEESGRSHAAEPSLSELPPAGCRLPTDLSLPPAHCLLPTDLLDVLSRLVDKSLVVAEPAPVADEIRYRMLETVRQYSRERLGAAGEAAWLRRRHRDWFLALAERAGPELHGAEQGEWMKRLEAEHENLRAALAASLEPAPASLAAGGENDGPEVALRLAAALWRFWYVRGHLSEGLDWLARALECVQESGARRAQALNGAGILACARGEYDRGRTFHEESLAIHRATGDRRGTAHSLNNLGLLARHQGDHATARRYYEESLAICQELGYMAGIGTALVNLGCTLSDQGESAAARRLLDQSLAIHRELGDRWLVAITLNNLGHIARKQEEYDTARALFAESLAMRRDLGDRRGIPVALRGLGMVAASQGDLERAVCLYGAAEAGREATGAPLPASDQEEMDAVVAEARNRLGEEAFARAWEQGRALAPEQAVDYALQQDRPATERRTAASAAREKETSR